MSGCAKRKRDIAQPEKRALQVCFLILAGFASARAADVEKGKILFEMDGVPMEIARECMRVAAHKIPLRTKFITRAHR